MTDRGNNKDALLEKLDNLMRSGRAQKRNDPPPVLNDTIPGESESNIPTLTDVVSTPDTIPDPGRSNDTENAGKEVAADLQGDSSLEFEAGSPDESDQNAPLEFERIEGFATPKEGSGNLEQQTPAKLQETTFEDSKPDISDDAGQPEPTVLHESISERLLGVLDEEMSSLLKELPSEKSKLSVLHRSLRFALPELVRLRWLEPPAEGASEDGSDGNSEPED